MKQRKVAGTRRRAAVIVEQGRGLSSSVATEAEVNNGGGDHNNARGQQRQFKRDSRDEAMSQSTMVLGQLAMR